MLADIMTWTDWDWAGAEREFKRAIELDPGLAQIERALELDPFNAIVQSFYVVDLFFVRRYDEAIAQCRKTQRTAPEAIVALAYLYLASEANAAAKSYDVIYGDLGTGALDRAFAQGGYRSAMKQMADALSARSRQTYVNPPDIANLYVSAGDKDRALEWLEKGLAVRDANMPYLG